MKFKVVKLLKYKNDNGTYSDKAINPSSMNMNSRALILIYRNYSNVPYHIAIYIGRMGEFDNDRDLCILVVKVS